jgi:hypothetical protein
MRRFDKRTIGSRAVLCGALVALLGNSAHAISYGSVLFTAAGSIWGGSHSRIDTFWESWIFDLIGVKAEMISGSYYSESPWEVLGVPNGTYPVEVIVVGTSPCPAGGTWEIFGHHQFVMEVGGVPYETSRALYIDPNTPCDY